MNEGRGSYGSKDAPARLVYLRPLPSRVAPEHVGENQLVRLLALPVHAEDLHNGVEELSVDYRVSPFGVLPELLELHPLVAVAARHGELLGLRWQDVDFEAGELRVMRQLVRARPKSDDGTALAFTSLNRGGSRVVSFGCRIAALLQAHRAAQHEERLKWGSAYTESEQVFTEEGGGSLPPWKSTRRFNTLRERAGLGKDVRMHTLRHTAATFAALEGAAPLVVKKMLGRKRIAETMDRYSHVVPTMQRDAEKRLESALLGDDIER